MATERDWKSIQLKKMRTIANQIADENKKHENVSAVLLFGSTATGKIHPESDIDLVVIRDLQENRMRRHQPTINGIEVDQWTHPLSYYSKLLKRDWHPKEMFLYSLFLGILQDCEILYDRESQLSEYRESALKWKWSDKYKAFIQGIYDNAIQGLRASDLPLIETLIYLRKIVLLDTCRLLLNLGKPVSNRNKDLYQAHVQILSTQDFERARSELNSRGESLVKL